MGLLHFMNSKRTAFSRKLKLKFAKHMLIFVKKNILSKCLL